MQWELIKQVAEDVAYDRHVPLDRLNGVIIVLALRQSWWHRTGSGNALCSLAAANEPKTVRTVLYDVFASSLDIA